MVDCIAAASAAIKAAAKACNVCDKELGELLGFATFMERKQLDAFPDVEKAEAVLQFMRTIADQRKGKFPSAAGKEESSAAGAAAAPRGCPGDTSGVLRLVDAGKTVGTCCLVSFGGRTFVLTARHCLDPKPGQRIDVKSCTAHGHRLRHLASFRKYDVTVLVLDDENQLPGVLQNASPFQVDAGTGLMRGVAVTLISVPLAADETVEGFQQSGVPMVATGRVSWLSGDAEEAIGSYAGVLPNASGGAVAFGPPYHYLAGVHVGAMWHPQGTDPRDIATAADQDDASGELVVETATWCGDNRSKGGEQQPAAPEEVMDRCVDNVAHKSSMGLFVPVFVLYRLLSRCHGLLPGKSK